MECFQHSGNTPSLKLRLKICCPVKSSANMFIFISPATINEKVLILLSNEFSDWRNAVGSLKDGDRYIPNIVVDFPRPNKRPFAFSRVTRKVDILAVKETWLREGETGRAPQVTGYRLRHIPRPPSVRTRGGGVGFYINKMMSVRLLSHPAVNLVVCDNRCG
ncbi:unnamed protein product [Leptosia nina]|uniref:Uncharacterized protein n=1 Tax=Leptosia nina TaxID=320188 RepID=A0AAV1JYG9_9NEOP